MKIRFLGTAAAEGVPALFCNCDFCKYANSVRGKEIRTRSQAIVDDKLLIDFPPDTFYHKINNNLHLSGVSTLIITHSHGDHLAPSELTKRGYPYSKNMREDVLDVYANEKSLSLIKEELKFENEKEINDAFTLSVAKAFESFVTRDGYKVTPLKAYHHLTENALVYLIEKDDKCILYCNDTGILKEESLNFLKGYKGKIDFASFDCTMGVNSVGDKGTHMGIDDVKVLDDKLRDMGVYKVGAKKVITHFSHNNLLPFEKMQEKANNYGFIVAYDGIEFEI